MPIRTRALILPWITVQAYRTHSVLCGPVKNLQGEVIGVVEIINKQGGAFTQEDEALFRAFTYQTAIAVENFRPTSTWSPAMRRWLSCWM